KTSAYDQNQGIETETETETETDTEDEQMSAGVFFKKPAVPMNNSTDVSRDMFSPKAVGESIGVNGVLPTLDVDTAALSIGENDGTEMPSLVQSVTNSLMDLEELAFSDSASDTDHDEDDGDGDDRLDKFTSSLQNTEPNAHLE
ncbi:hypothetical protein BGZ82_004892, partial [Podila clonocystis]